jgi:hypothetical protein
VALISIPGHEPQRFRKQTIRELVARASADLPADGDRFVLEQGSALEGLYFDTMDREQQRRIAAALMAAADAYRAELIGDPDESSQSRAEALGELSMLLTSLV